MRKPRGHIRPHGAGHEEAVSVGLNPITKRYRYLYEQVATMEEAEAARDWMGAAVTAGRVPRTKATFGELLDRMLEVADLDFTTKGMYQGYIERTIQPALGELPVYDLQQHPELLDRLYAALRRCRRLCGGRRSLVDHRPAGRGKRRAGARRTICATSGAARTSAARPSQRRWRRSTRSSSGRSATGSAGSGSTKTPLYRLARRKSRLSTPTRPAPTRLFGCWLCSLLTYADDAVPVEVGVDCGTRSSRSRRSLGRCRLHHRR
jgi:hypothetical protein